jgi:transposase
MFLPPYSPDYNPIEQAFSCIKAWLRRNYMDKSLTALSRACQQITPQMATGFFQSSGYI